ncbi:hypothetical protein SASPL_119128 [Salvia splendens]|uniref:Peptidase M41 domain-containing protein n=1 Tax=Salvia splendens TaxID=180675 RepID=A0A8X8Y3M3_SALSN|nr:hypothetical protein SASPL_119128 [Salvia splendens]
MSISLQAFIICKHSIPQSKPLLFSSPLNFISLEDQSAAPPNHPRPSGQESGGDVKNERRVPIVVFLVGVFARLREGFEKLLYSDWFSWWPFWRQEKRLERLIAEADSNPKDAAKQSALLVELNKHSPSWSTDLANLVNIAAIKAAVEGAEKLNAAQLEFAKDRIMMGTERKTMFLSEDSKKLTAYHESGHAIVALNTEGAHPIHKATIMPRGSALGMVTQLPSNDETSISKKQLLARLDVCMGGRVAEELIFGKDHVTTGASSDLNTATKLAQYIVFPVSSCGMSDEIGPVHIKERPSSEMQSRIDAEVVKLLREAYNRVKALLKKHEKALHALANALLEYETLNAEEIKRILVPYSGSELFVELEQQQAEEELVLA